MSVEDSYSHFFKPEVRKQGAEYFTEGKVFLSIAGDAQIQAYVKVSSPVKVAFTAESIASESFTADCSCSHSAKGQLCKHIWAAPLEVEKSHPDFLDSKKDIEKGSGFKKPEAAAQKAKAPSDFQEAQKARQADYRKQQYQKQKQRLKDQKQEKKQHKSKSFAPASTLPEEVEEALKYFEENGFHLEVPVAKDDVESARKILARVFHPDKGGSHEEILALNRNYDVLVEFGAD